MKLVKLAFSNIFAKNYMDFNNFFIITKHNNSVLNGSAILI